MDISRYLRARKFVPNDAYGQFKDTEDWRKANKIDHLYDTIDIDEYDMTRRLVGCLHQTFARACQRRLTRCPRILVSAMDRSTR